MFADFVCAHLDFSHELRFLLTRAKDNLQGENLKHVSLLRPFPKALCADEVAEKTEYRSWIEIKRSSEAIFENPVRTTGVSAFKHNAGNGHYFCTLTVGRDPSAFIRIFIFSD